MICRVINFLTPIVLYSDYLYWLITISIYSDFKYPKELKDGRVVFIKQGMGSYKEIQLIDKNGKNNKLIIPGMIKDIERVPNSNNVIGWIEFD